MNKPSLHNFFNTKKLKSNILSSNKISQLIIIILSLFLLSGVAIFHDNYSKKTMNTLNMSKDTMKLLDFIEIDASINNITAPSVIAAKNFMDSTRKYAGNIRFLSNQYSENQTTPEFDVSSLIQRNINAQNWDIVTFYGILTSSNYLVVEASQNNIKSLLSLGYETVKIDETFGVFKYTAGQKRQNRGKWLVTQYGKSDGNQSMFYTIQNTNGYLIVIDGGWREDAEYVTTVIDSLGGHVNVWFLTHPHPDHIGAFCDIYSRSSRPTIDNIYAVDMASPQLCKKNASWDSTDTYEHFLTLNIPELNFLHADDFLKLDGLNIQIFSAYDDYVDKLSSDLLNDGSMMLKMTTDNESMLFCSDIGKSLSNFLLKKYKEKLNADYIQMGHHGNGGLKSNFYKTIGAKVAFFDAPDWLMQDTTNKYTTPANIKLMKKYGSKIYSFSTAPNQIIIE